MHENKYIETSYKFLLCDMFRNLVREPELIRFLSADQSAIEVCCVTIFRRISPRLTVRSSSAESVRDRKRKTVKETVPPPP